MTPDPVDAAAEESARNDTEIDRHCEVGAHRRGFKAGARYARENPSEGVAELVALVELADFFDPKTRDRQKEILAKFREQDRE